MATTQILQLGDEYCVRIPKDLLEELGAHKDDVFEVHSVEGSITITPIQNLTLENLLAQITLENIQKEIQL